MGIIIGGKRKDNGEWVYGAYFYIRHTDGRNHTHHLIIPDGIDMSIGTPIEKIQVEVDPDTMGIFSWDGNTEPKELLFVEREKVIKKCDEVTKDYAETGDKWCSGYINALNDFFGNKCLSDNNDSKGIDCNKLDQMLDEALEKETPESLNKWLDEQNQSSQSGSGFKKGDIVKFMGNYCKVTDCPTEPHYALSYLVGAHRGQSVVGPIKESHIKACPEFEAIPFKIGDRVRERDYEESFGTVVAFNVNGKCEITMFVQLDKEGRYIEGYPDEFVAIPPKPKFNIGDKVVGSNEHTAKEWPGVMEITKINSEKAARSSASRMNQPCFLIYSSTTASLTSPTVPTK